jgi:GTPase Era involved in 16S rRNA processing
MKENYPRFAVVGHPNKGKSSIVSTLALDESVQVSDIPGTTTEQRSFPLKIDGKILYELYDTPGFQRARALLEWLEKEEVPADRKVERVKRFVYEHRDDPRFHDEIELLDPILGGAGIIYVVDGSKPYGAEYEAEMEILRWTGQPSMALINLIDDTDYVEEWKRALGHYFRMVRVFNPMEAHFSQHIALLESMAQLKEEWTPSVKRSIRIFNDYQKQKIYDSAQLVTELIADSLSYVESQQISGEEASEQEKERVLEHYKIHLRKLEEHAHRKIAKTWHHLQLQKESLLPLFEEMDLFSKESESLFGLSRRELVLTGAAGGALTGSGIDLMLGGTSLMLGSAIGALVGGAGAMLGFSEIAEMKVLGQKLGSRRLEVGPIQNKNFPYILLRRALYYTQEVANRPHADRSKIPMDSEVLFGSQWIDNETKKELEKLHQEFRSGNAIKEKKFQHYREMVQAILLKQIEH